MTHTASREPTVIYSYASITTPWGQVEVTSLRLGSDGTVELSGRIQPPRITLPDYDDPRNGLPLKGWQG